MIKTYDVHEFAALVPMASLNEQALLNKDILENGLKEPVVLWNDRIVDGRCRQIACKLADEKIRYKELDSNLSEHEVKSFVKSVNTRRNLTTTQKIMIACRQKLDLSTNGTIKNIAESWGISVGILNNALYIAKNRPEFIQALFDGKSVEIINQDGKEILSTKVTAIFAYLKRNEEDANINNEHAWKEDSYIATQIGKEWYYEKISELKLTKKDIQVKMMIAELANYKFTKENK